MRSAGGKKGAGLGAGLGQGSSPASVLRDLFLLEKQKGVTLRPSRGVLALEVRVQPQSVLPAPTSSGETITTLLWPLNLGSSLESLGGRGGGGVGNFLKGKYLGPTPDQLKGERGWYGGPGHQDFPPLLGWFFVGVVVAGGQLMRDLSSLTRNGTYAPCSGSPSS